MNLNEVSQNPYTHCGITAPVALWISAGMQFSSWGEEFSLRPALSSWGDPLTEGQLIEARATTGDSGEKALVWLIAERRRRGEERERNHAAQITADAQKKSGDDAIHAARIHRQAEELRCLANGVDKAAINSRLV
jgi:hypothetical protein